MELYASGSIAISRAKSNAQAPHFPKTFSADETAVSIIGTTGFVCKRLVPRLQASILTISTSTSHATIPYPVKLDLFGSRCRLNRRNFTFQGIVAAGTLVMHSLPVDAQPSKSQGLEKLPFKADGYNYWTWRDRKIHLRSGRGGHPHCSNSWLWGFRISLECTPLPELAKNYKVYAIDLLGFGWSEKALVEYDALVWRDQVVDFVKEIVKEPAVLVGNRLMSRFMSNQKKYTLDSVLSQLSCPLLLVWGDLDTWVGPAKAVRTKEFYKDTSLVSLQAGHCPHD